MWKHVEQVFLCKNLAIRQWLAEHRHFLNILYLIGEQLWKGNFALWKSLDVQMA
jgi:hypothetical protein